MTGVQTCALPISRPFGQIAMDLITGLPSSHGYDAILTIVDHGCSRAALFLPCQTTISGPSIAQLYLRHLYPWFGIPDRIISDRDLRFTSHFSQSLTQELGITRNLSMAFHPQMDGLTECTNQWVVLPLAQYVTINTVSRLKASRYAT